MRIPRRWIPPLLLSLFLALAIVWLASVAISLQSQSQLLAAAAVQSAKDQSQPIQMMATDAPPVGVQLDLSNLEDICRTLSTNSSGQSSGSASSGGGGGSATADRGAAAFATGTGNIIVEGHVMAISVDGSNNTATVTIPEASPEQQSTVSSDGSARTSEPESTSTAPPSVSNSLTPADATSQLSTSDSPQDPPTPAASDAEAE